MGQSYVTHFTTNPACVDELVKIIALHILRDPAAGPKRNRQHKMKILVLGIPVRPCLDTCAYECG